MNAIAPATPFTWTPEQQRRAHGLTVRATYAKKAPAKPVPCPTCHLLHPGEC